MFLSMRFVKPMIIIMPTYHDNPILNIIYRVAYCWARDRLTDPRRPETPRAIKADPLAGLRGFAPDLASHPDTADSVRSGVADALEGRPPRR